METNVTRLVKSMKIVHEIKEYEFDEDDLSAHSVAIKIGFELDRVFKTLVARGGSGAVYVFVIPGSAELNVKKCSALCGEKSIALLPLKDLETTTGYVRGGCSPIGMKKRYPTFIDETALLWESISVSAGKRGVQIILAPKDLAALAHAEFADLL